MKLSANRRRTPQVSRLLLLAALALAPNGEFVAAESIQALRMRQTTSGLPTQLSAGEKDEAGRSWQELIIDRAGRRVRLTEFGDSSFETVRDVYVLTQVEDESVVWHFPAGRGNRYREFRSDLNEHQRNRRIRELNMLRQIMTYAPKERKAALEKHHLLPGGKRDVRVAHSDGPQHLGFPTRHFVVTENGRVILDADLSESIPGDAATAEGGSYFELYRRLGVFSQEVLDAMRDVNGVPLRAKITAVTELPTYTLDVVVSSVERVRVENALFELPAGAEKIPDVPPFTNCPHCGKRFETAKGIQLIRNEATYFVCSSECSTAFRRTLRELETRRRSGGTPDKNGESPKRPEDER